MSEYTPDQKAQLRQAEAEDAAWEETEILAEIKRSEMASEERDRRYEEFQRKIGKTPATKAEPKADTSLEALELEAEARKAAIADAARLGPAHKKAATEAYVAAQEAVFARRQTESDLAMRQAMQIDFERKARQAVELSDANERARMADALRDIWTNPIESWAYKSLVERQTQTFDDRVRDNLTAKLSEVTDGRFGERISGPPQSVQLPTMADLSAGKVTVEQMQALRAEVERKKKS